MNERVRYEHRQIGWLTLVAIFAILALISAAFAGSERTDADRTAYNVVVSVVAIIAALFSSLTVRVTDTYVAWWFGLPLIGRRVRLDEIASAVPTKTSLLEGWGIHLTYWHGWVWNVSGFNAVEITLQSGTRFAVGTPEPKAVVDAIDAARGGTIRR